MKGVTLVVPRTIGGASIKCIAKYTGVANGMTGGESRRVAHRDGRIKRVGIGEIHALVAHRGHRRRGVRCNGEGAQAVRDKQNEVARTLRVGGRNLQKNGCADREKALSHSNCPNLLDAVLDTPASRHYCSIE